MGKETSGGIKEEKIVHVMSFPPFFLAFYLSLLGTCSPESFCLPLENWVQIFPLGCWGGALKPKV